MKHIGFVLIAILFLTSCANQFTNAHNQNKVSWERYTISSLDNIVQLHKDDVEPNSYFITAMEFALLVPVVYLDSTRTLADDKRDIIQMWSKTRNASLEHINEFQTELLISENGHNFWLPLQSNLIDALKLNCRKGDKIEIYTQWVGAIRYEGDTEWIFLINGFIE